MQFLKKYAAQNGFSYKDLINDFYSSSPEEQNSFFDGRTGIEIGHSLKFHFLGL
jgi:hypothetical protein